MKKELIVFFRFLAKLLSILGLGLFLFLLSCWLCEQFYCHQSDRIMFVSLHTQELTFQFWLHLNIIMTNGNLRSFFFFCFFFFVIIQCKTLDCIFSLSLFFIILNQSDLWLKMCMYMASIVGSYFLSLMFVDTDCDLCPIEESVCVRTYVSFSRRRRRSIMISSL